MQYQVIRNEIIIAELYKLPFPASSFQNRLRIHHKKRPFHRQFFIYFFINADPKLTLQADLNELNSVFVKIKSFIILAVFRRRA